MKLEVGRLTFHARMGTVKGRNGRDLTEAEEIKRCQEHAEELYKKGLPDPDNRDGVALHLSLDILKLEVTWALGDVAVNEADEVTGFQCGCLKSRKMGFRCCAQCLSRLESSAVATVLGRSVFTPVSKDV